MSQLVGRRAVLASLAGLSVIGSEGRARADLGLDEHEIMDLHVSGNARLGKRATVFTPKSNRGGLFPILVLLHGLGETGNERDGVYAWAQRYGLLSSYRRLLRSSVMDGVSRSNGYLRVSRAEQLDRQLMLHPFRGMVLVCPYTPNVFAMNTSSALDEYAAWIVEVLLPEVRSRTPTREGMRWTGIDGCSLGGFVSYHVFQRRPEAFFTCGGVQAAIGKAAAVEHAERFRSAVERVGLRRIHLETSTQDPYHDANVELARLLGRSGVEHELRVSPGPHNQPWLIEVGTLEMLLWHDRQLRG